MRVLAVTTHSDRPEMETYRRLLDAGVDLQVLCHPESPSYERMRNAGIPVSGQILRTRFDLRAIRKLRSGLRDGRFDILHSFNNRALTNGLVASTGLPVRIVAYRGTLGHVNRWSPGSRLSYLHRRVDRIVCVSNAVRDYLAHQGVPQGRLVTIYKGHDVDWYRRGTRGDLGALGVPDDAFVVGCTANMRPLKGVDVLIESLRHIPGDRRVHLLLVGEVRHKRVESLARRPEFRQRLTLTGYRPDAPTLMGACDLFVMPSLRREGLSKAVLEAMAQGTPAIVTNVGGMPEVVADPETGRVVPPGDPRAIAEAIRGFLDDPERLARTGAAARERIRSRFSIEATARQTLELYRDLLAKGETPVAGAPAASGR